MSDDIQTEWINACIINNDFKKYSKLFHALSVDKQLAFIIHDRYQSLHLAMANGHLDIFNEMVSFIFTHFDEDRVVSAFEARNGEGFKIALDKHHWALIEDLMNDEYLQYHCFKIILESEQYIALILSQPSLKQFIPDLFNLACRQNVLSVQRVLNVVPFENLANLFKFHERDFSNPSIQWGPFENAADANETAVIEYIWNLIPDEFKMNVVQYYFPECLMIAAKKGYTAVIETIFKFLSQEQQRQLLKFQDYNVFVYAADRGHIEIIKLIWETLLKDEKKAALAASNFAAHRLALQNNHQEILDFFDSVTPLE